DDVDAEHAARAGDEPGPLSAVGHKFSPLSSLHPSVSHGLLGTILRVPGPFPGSWMTEVRMNIAVTGCRKTLPLEFPLKLRENAGNMIHANAPFEMFPGAVDYADGDWRASGARSFAEYVDEHCSHLIVTMANSFRSGEQDGTRYSRFISMLEQYNKPIVVFGLGIQAPTTDLDRVELHPEAI